jgi:hypothetical protein
MPEGTLRAILRQAGVDLATSEGLNVNGAARTSGPLLSHQGLG